MKNLPENWLLQHWDDEEMLQYQLLDYVRSVYDELDNQRLFPAWEAVYDQYLQLKTLSAAIEKHQKLAPRQLDGLETNPMQPVYRYLPHAGAEALETVQNRLQFAAPILKKACQYSENLRESVDEKVEFEPLGLLVPNKNEGFLMIQSYNLNEVWCWNYHCSVQANARAGYSTLRTRFAGKFAVSLSQGLHTVKNICATNAGLKGQLFSTWVLTAKQSWPMLHTLKPMGVLRLANELGLK